jgi:hypothetical protein
MSDSWSCDEFASKFVELIRLGSWELQGQNIDFDENHESRMEEWRATHHVGRKGRKRQNSSGQNLRQKDMSKPFAVPSVSSGNIDKALYN